MHGPTGLPRPSNQTEVSAMLVTPAPTTGAGGAASKAPAAAFRAPSSRSAAVVSAPVGPERQAVGTLAQASSWPSAPTTAALVLVVPTSMPKSRPGASCSAIRLPPGAGRGRVPCPGASWQAAGWPGQWRWPSPRRRWPRGVLSWGDLPRAACHDLGRHHDAPRRATGAVEAVADQAGGPAAELDWVVRDDADRWRQERCQLEVVEADKGRRPLQACKCGEHAEGNAVVPSKIGRRRLLEREQLAGSLLGARAVVAADPDKPCVHRQAGSFEGCPVTSQALRSGKDPRQVPH